MLAFILCLALTTWGWRMFTLGSMRAIAAGCVGITLLCLTYVASYLVVQHVIEQTATVAQVAPNVQLASLVIALGFVVLFALHVLFVWRLRPSWLEPMRVHAANGFYIDAIYQRIFASLA